MTMLEQVGKQAPHNLFRPAGDPDGRHSGEDTGWASGDDIFAAADGVVTHVYTGDGYNQGWGRRIVIEHEGGSSTTYNHMDAGDVFVKFGDRVKAGQHIADMGSSGKVTAKHLHFELYIDGVRVNPRPYFTTKHLPGTGSPAGGGGTPATSTRQRVVRHKVNGRSKPSTSATIRQSLSAGTVGNFDGFIRGEKVTQNGITSSIWYRGAYSGDFFWAGNFTEIKAAGLKDLGSYKPSAPAKPKRKLRLPAYFWYKNSANAEREQHPRGGKYTGEPMLVGDYDVIGTSKGGAYQVRSRANGVVWVSPRAKKYLVR